MSQAAAENKLKRRDDITIVRCAGKGHLMTLSNIIGLIALIIGVILLFFAYQASNAPANQISEALTGQVTDNTMLYLIGGVIGVVVGAGLLLKGFKRG